ncbi:hypothetical protein M378DRAFT_16974 [Amanita muscaria Koide BX008]|uniref:Snf2 ATP coupling domain-containing protein n=1 Tax=Amanita muscaria (strain Koide BX008) TaxID=946122 RepID=A0A0C2S1R4_AMAMK|nr:hypothetical protein M378DRAFT_16974 [Amanita muscaria Koide BX008]
MNDEWRNAGNRGKPPLPLMQLEELPECYQTDEPFENKETEEVPRDRGTRRRNIIRQTRHSAMIDDAWAMVLEEGEDLQELSERAREKKERRATNKLLKEAEASSRPQPSLMPYPSLQFSLALLQLLLSFASTHVSLLQAVM